MKKFFYRKVEVWLVLLLFILGLFGMLIFAAVLRNELMGQDRFGRLGDIAATIAEQPSNPDYSPDLLHNRLFLCEKALGGIIL